MRKHFYSPFFFTFSFLSLARIIVFLFAAVESGGQSVDL